jgi:hypothetical protein
MSSDLKVSRNYGELTFSKLNRKYEPEDHQKLKISMTTCGYIKSFPATILMVNGKKVVIDGQHRIKMAQELGLPYWYVIVEIKDVDVETLIQLINNGQVPWNIKNYIGHFSQRGLEDYIELEEFINKYKLPRTTCASILVGWNGGGRICDKLREGTFKIKDRKYAADVAEMIVQIKQVSSKATNKNCVEAIAAICRDSQIDKARLITRIKNHPQMLIASGTMEMVLDSLEKIYNFGARSLYGVKVGALNVMKERKMSSMGKKN